MLRVSPTGRECRSGEASLAPPCDGLAGAGALDFISTCVACAAELVDEASLAPLGNSGSLKINASSDAALMIHSMPKVVRIFCATMSPLRQ